MAETVVQVQMRVQVRVQVRVWRYCVDTGTYIELRKKEYADIQAERASCTEYAYCHPVQCRYGCIPTARDTAGWAVEAGPDSDSISMSPTFVAEWLQEVAWQGRVAPIHPTEVADGAVNIAGAEKRSYEGVRVGGLRDTLFSMSGRCVGFPWYISDDWRARFQSGSLDKGIRRPPKMSRK